MGIDVQSSNQIIQPEVVDIIISEFNFVGVRVQKQEKDISRRPPVHDSNFPKRPPIVAIVGHINHGKTTLLDTMRTNLVAKKEAGGITQHIGPFQGLE